MILKRLQELGYKLPVPPTPAASYLPATCFQNMIFVSGQLPLQNGKLLMKGKVSSHTPLGKVQEAVLCCFLNGLAATASVVDSIDRIQKLIRLGVYVASEPSFTNQHLVAEGASKPALELFGEGHSRFAVGVSSLPLDASVELEMIFSLLEEKPSSMRLG